MPNGCTHADPFIFPNLKKLSSKEAMTKEWYVGCKFYDPVFKEKYPKGYFWRRKGLAEFKTFSERKEAAELLIDEMRRALDNCFNPIAGVFQYYDEGDFNPELFLMEALNLAFKDHSDKVTRRYAQDIANNLKKIHPIAIRLKIDKVPIKNIELKHIKKILDNCDLSAYSYNMLKKHLSVLFKILCYNSCLTLNPCDNIQNKQHVKAEREILSKKTFVRIYSYLKNIKPGYANYCKIFHMSGCRSTELLAVRKTDVDLENQEFTVLVKKRRNYTKEIRPIVKMAIPFWKRQLEECQNDDDYLFGIGFEPECREKPIDDKNPSKYWRKYVQKQFKTKVTFYSLKHMFLTMIETSYGIKAAQTMAGHLSSRTTETYTLFKKKNEIQELKGLDFTPKWVQTSELLELSPEQYN